jgi:hypothetical protein
VLLWSPYMLGGTVLDRVSSKRSRSHHGRENDFYGACESEVIRRLSLEFRDPYTLIRLWFVQNWNIYKLCVEPTRWCSCWQSRTRAEAVYAICFAWFGLDGHAWLTTIRWLMRLSVSWHPYKKAVVYFIFDVLSGRGNSPNLLSVLDLITQRYPTQTLATTFEFNFLF